MISQYDKVWVKKHYPSEEPNKGWCLGDVGEGALLRYDPSTGTGSCINIYGGYGQGIDTNSYGICEGTSKAIKKARLRAKPWARYCVGYAEMIENGQVPEED